VAFGGECGGRRPGLEEALRGRGGRLGRVTASREGADGGSRAYEAGWRGSKVLPQRSQPARRCESESESNRTKTPTRIGTPVLIGKKSIGTPAQIGKKIHGKFYMNSSSTQTPSLFSRLKNMSLGYLVFAGFQS